MIQCSPTDLLLGGVGYTLALPNASPVRSLVLTADAGVSWDQLQEQRICEGFFPPNAVFESVLGGHYLFKTDGGTVDFQPLPNQCVLKLTGV